jgi:WD40 repeat protein
VAWSPDGKLLATGGDSMQVLVWDSRSLSVIKELSQGSRGVGRNNVAFSPDGRYLASGLKIVNVWDTETWGLRTNFIAPHVIPTSPQDVNIESLAYSPNGKLLVVAYAGIKWVVIAYQLDDGKIAWSYETKATIGKPLLTTPLVFTPDGTSVVLGTGEQRPGVDVDLERLSKILILDASSGTLRNSIDGIHVDKPTALAITRDGQWIATATSTGVIDSHLNIKTHAVTRVENKDPIRVWEIATRKVISELPVTSRVWSLAFSPEGRYVIATKSDTRNHMTIAVWDISSGKLIQELQTWPVPIGLAVSPDGKRFATTGDGRLSLFEFAPN